MQAESTLEASALEDSTGGAAPVLYVVHTPGGAGPPTPIPVVGEVASRSGPGAAPRGREAPAPGGVAELQVGRAPLGGGLSLKRDKRTSRVHAVFTVEARGDDDVLVVENVSRNGTRLNGAPVERAEVPDGAVLRVGDSLLVARLRGPAPDAPAGAGVHGLIGASSEVRHLREQIALVGPSDAWVLVLGPTGAGKEVVARALHDVSKRKGPFIAVNCGAIPEQLAESQLFGHKKGAFTGAESDRTGYFEDASGGTLFLDEVGELPSALQPKLLRALDDRSVVRVGETRPRPIDVRVVAATHQDLEGHIEAGTFRGDLYARLAEIILRLPPLSSRREDVLLLLEHFLPAGAPELSADLAEALLLHPWPFHVRELRKVAKELEVRGRGQARLEKGLIEARLKSPDGKADDGRGADGVRPMGASASDRRPGSPIRRGARPAAPSSPPPARDELLRQVTRHHGNVARVAQALGKSRKQTYRYLQQHGIDPERYRQGPRADGEGAPDDDDAPA